MSWLQALLLGLVQGLTEFLPVSSSGHLMIFRELLGVDSEGFMDFTVMVHFDAQGFDQAQNVIKAIGYFLFVLFNFNR